MTLTFELWLGRLLSDTPDRSPLSRERSPMRIEVEPLPDYLWRALGFQWPLCRDRE